MITLHDFLVSLFSSFGSHGIRYCVLRNYELLPVDNIGADIDVLIEKDRAECVFNLLAQIEIVRITATTRRAYVRTAFIDGLSFGSGKDSLQVDFVTDLAWKGVPYLHSQDVLDSSRSYSTHPLIRVPASHHEAIISMFSSYLSGGWIKERYQSSVQAEFRQNELLVRDSLAPFLGYNLLRRLLDAVREDCRGALLGMLPLVKFHLVVHGFIRSPMSSGWAVLTHHWLELKVRLTSRTIVQVCMLGMDGAGKSTIIGALVARLGNRTKAYEVIHLKPAVRFRRARISGVAAAQPHAAAPRGSAMSVLKLLSWVGLYHLRKRLHWRKTSTLVVWDRYIYDVLVDPQRYRVDLPKLVLRMLVRLAPVPEAVVVLDLAPEIAFKRKQEIPLMELHGIRRGYVELAATMPFAKVVSTEGSVEEAVEEIVEFVSEAMARKASAH